MKRAEDIPKFNKKIWTAIAQKIKSLIILDASKGIFQTGGKAKKRYASSPSDKGSYAYYKSRGMRKIGRGNSRIGKGDKLKGFTGKSTDTTTAFVNMKLTGETLRRISASSLAGGGCKITFNRGEIVEGNSKRGYVLDDLRDANYTRIETILSKELNRKIERFSREKLTYRIG